MSELRILEKVKLILAKTTENGATDAEAQSAFLKAQELLAKHGLNMDDVENYNPSDKQICQAEGTTKYDQKFRFPLARLIANSFRCEYFRRGGKRIMFIGYKEDVAVCREVFNAAYAFIYREAWKRQRKAYAETGNGEGVVNGYALGFIAGLKVHLDAQSVALMVVTPKEVTDAKDKCCTPEGAKKPKTFTRNLTAVANSASVQAQRDGYHDGKTFMNGKRVTGDAD